MPITIPADLSAVTFVQIRMVGAIASMGGFDLKNDKVRSFAYMCLVGRGAGEILKDLGIGLGTKLTGEVIKRISRDTIVAINRRVGFRLMTKFGEKGFVNLGKLVPIAGGVVGAAFDALPTQIIGSAAIRLFIGSQDSPP